MASRPRPPGRRGRRAHEEAVARRLGAAGSELESARVIRDPEEESHTRVRAVGRPSAPPAARRRRSWPRWSRRRGRHLARGRWGAALALGPGQLAVVALLVLAGVGAVAWWLTGGGSAEVVAPPPLRRRPGQPVGRPDDRPAAGAGTAVRPARPCGRVERHRDGRRRGQGTATGHRRARHRGARGRRAAAAGGARAGVDLTGLNLARLLVDGEQILVGVEPPAGWRRA